MKEGTKMSEPSMTPFERVSYHFTTYSCEDIAIVLNVFEYNNKNVKFAS